MVRLTYLQCHSLLRNGKRTKDANIDRTTWNVFRRVPPMELWGLQNHRKGDFLINQIYLFIRIHANEPNLIARQLYVLRLHIEIKVPKLV